MKLMFFSEIILFLFVKVKIKKSFDEYVLIIFLYFFKSLSPSRIKVSVEASNWKFLEFIEKTIKIPRSINRNIFKCLVSNFEYKFCIIHAIYLLW